MDTASSRCTATSLRRRLKTSPTPASSVGRRRACIPLAITCTEDWRERREARPGGVLKPSQHPGFVHGLSLLGRECGCAAVRISLAVGRPTEIAVACLRRGGGRHQAFVACATRTTSQPPFGGRVGLDNELFQSSIVSDVEVRPEPVPSGVRYNPVLPDPSIRFLLRGLRSTPVTERVHDDEAVRFDDCAKCSFAARESLSTSFFYCIGLFRSNSIVVTTTSTRCSEPSDCSARRRALLGRAGERTLCSCF